MIDRIGDGIRYGFSFITYGLCHANFFARMISRGILCGLLAITVKKTYDFSIYYFNKHYRKDAEKGKNEQTKEFSATKQSENSDDNIKKINSELVKSKSSESSPTFSPIGYPNGNNGNQFDLVRTSEAVDPAEEAEEENPEIPNKKYNKIIGDDSQKKKKGWGFF